MKSDAFVEGSELSLREDGAVDGVIVYDEVDSAGIRIVLREHLQESAEERSALALRTGRVELSGGHVEGASEVELLVLSWGDDAPLVAA